MHIVFESGRMRRLFARLVSTAKYRVARPVASAAAYHLARRGRGAPALAADGRALRPGITYCLVAKNEEETVSRCLRSLVGLVDQVVCIDNGSTDDTLAAMRRFAVEAPGLDVKILSRPSGTLCELRQECAGHVERTWFIRGDADMVFLDALRVYRTRLLERERPAAVLCRKVDLFGDAEHYNRLFGAVSAGEYFLRSYDRGLRYVEYLGRLEHAPLPLHYELIRPDFLSFLHLDSHKPNERLIYRTCYLDWREHANAAGAAAVPLERYRLQWLRHNFETDEPLAQRFRMARLMGEQCARLDADLRAFVRENLPVPDGGRFVVEYRDGRPYLRRDTRDGELLAYRPSPADLAWAPEPARFYRDSVRTRFDLVA